MPASLKLPPEREAAETVKDELVDLKDNRAYLLLQGRIADLLQQAQAALEREQDVLLLKGLQGQALAYRRVMGLLGDVLREIEGRDYNKEKVLNGN